MIRIVLCLLATAGCLAGDDERPPEPRTFDAGIDAAVRDAAAVLDARPPAVLISDAGSPDAFVEIPCPGPECEPASLVIESVTLEPVDCPSSFGAEPDLVEAELGDTPTLVHTYTPHVWEYFDVESLGGRVTGVRWFWTSKQRLTAYLDGVVVVELEVYSDATGELVERCAWKGAGHVR